MWQNLRNHPFFKSIDWALLEQRQLSSPIPIELQGPHDAVNLSCEQDSVSAADAPIVHDKLAYEQSEADLALDAFFWALALNGALINVMIATHSVFSVEQKVFHWTLYKQNSCRHDIVDDIIEYMKSIKSGPRLSSYECASAWQEGQPLLLPSAPIWREVFARPPEFWYQMPKCALRWPRRRTTNWRLRQTEKYKNCGHSCSVVTHTQTHPHSIHTPWWVELLFVSTHNVHYQGGNLSLKYLTILKTQVSSITKYY